jgi:hypothetical protein
MKTKSIIAERDRIEALFKKIKVFSSDPELSSHWARYLCVIVNGFIENCIRDFFHLYTERRAGHEIVSYVSSKLYRDSHNPKYGVILQIAGNFDPILCQELEKVEEDIKEAINSVVNNRHKIAHGESVGLSYSQIDEYYGKIKKFIEILEILVLK